MIKHYNLFLNALHFNVVKVKAISDFIDFPLSYIVLFICNYSLSVLNNAMVPTAVCCCCCCAKSLQSCPTLRDPIDRSPPGSPVPWILQARTLEWVASSFSNAWKWKVKVRSLSQVRLLVTPWTAAHQAPPSMGFFQARVLEWGAIAFSFIPLRSPQTSSIVSL